MRATHARGAALLTLALTLAACGGSDDVTPAPDAGEDTSIADATPDAAPEPDARPVDTAEPETPGPDVTPDLPPDVEPDIAPDIAPDVVPDVAPDVAEDVPPDVAPEDDADTTVEPPEPADCTVMGRLDAAVATDEPGGLTYAFACASPESALSGAWSWSATHRVATETRTSNPLARPPVWDAGSEAVLVTVPVPDPGITGRWDATIIDPDGVAHAAELRVRIPDSDVQWPPGRVVDAVPLSARILRAVGSAWSEERFVVWSREGRVEGALVRGERTGRAVALELPHDEGDDFDAPDATHRMLYQHTDLRGTPSGAVLVWARADGGQIDARLWAISEEGGAPLAVVQPLPTETIQRVHDLLIVRDGDQLALAVLSGTTNRRARIDVLPFVEDGIRPPVATFIEYTTIGPWNGRSDSEAFQFWPLMDPSPGAVPRLDEVGMRVADASANGTFRMALATAPRDLSAPVQRGLVEGLLPLSTPPEGEPPRIRLSAAPWGRRDAARPAEVPPLRGAVWFGFAPYGSVARSNGALAYHDEGGTRPTFRGQAVLFPDMPDAFAGVLHDGHLTSPDEDGHLTVHGAAASGAFAARLTVCAWSTETCARDTRVRFERRLPPAQFTMRAWPDAWGKVPWIVQYGAMPMVMGTPDRPLAFDERVALQPVGDRQKDGPFVFYRTLSCRDFDRAQPTCTPTIYQGEGAGSGAYSPIFATYEGNAEDACVAVREDGELLCGSTSHFRVAPGLDGGEVDPIRLSPRVRDAVHFGMVPVELVEDGALVPRVVYAHVERDGGATWRLAALTEWDAALEPRGEGMLAFSTEDDVLGGIPTGIPVPACTGDPFTSASPLCPRVMHRLEPDPASITGVPLRMHRDLIAVVVRPELDAACPIVLARWADGDVSGAFDILSQGTGPECAGLHLPLGVVALPIPPMHALDALRAIGAPTGTAFRAWEARWSTADALLTARLPARGNAAEASDATLWSFHLRRTTTPDVLPVQLPVASVVDWTVPFGFPRVSDINGDGLHDVLALTEPGDRTGRWTDLSAQGSFKYFED